MRCRCGGESSAAARRRRRGEGATNASVKVSRGWRRRNHLLAASGLHGPGPAEAADTGGPTDTAHTVGRHLCTPPRAVNVLWLSCGVRGVAARRVLPVGWLRGGRSSNARRTANNKAEMNV